MKTLVLQSGKNLVYTLCGVNQSESELTISITTTNSTTEIETIATNEADTLALLNDIEANKYTQYTVFDSLSKDKTGVITIVYQKDSLAYQIKSLEETISKLQNRIVHDEIALCEVYELNVANEEVGE